MTDPIIYNEAPKYFHYYYGLIPSNDLITALEENLKFTLELLQSVPSEKENYAYNAGKWTTKEVFSTSLNASAYLLTALCAFRGLTALHFQDLMRMITLKIRKE